MASSTGLGPRGPPCPGAGGTFCTVAEKAMNHEPMEITKGATQALVTFGLMYVTNVLMLQLVCRGLMAGVQVPSPWLAPLVISIGSWFIAFSATAQKVPPAGGQGGPRGPKPVDDAIDV